MLRAIRVVAPCAVIASIAACSGAGNTPEQTGTSEQDLTRFSIYEPTTIAVKTDAGTDTSSADSAIKVLSPAITTGDLALEPATAYPPCAPTRFDITTSPGRTCWDLAKTTPTGTFSVAPIFSSAPAAIRDTRCAVTWLPKSGASCAYPDWDALALTCGERHSRVQRSAECAVDPSKCSASGTVAPVATATAAREPWSCEEIDYLDSGIIPGGYAGGCDSCGIITGGMLYLTNPYGTSNVLTNVSTPTGTQQVSIAVPSFTTTAVPVPTTYTSGSLYIWKP